MRGFPVSAAVIGVLLGLAAKYTYERQQWWELALVTFAAGHQIYVALSAHSD